MNRYLLLLMLSIVTVACQSNEDENIVEKEKLTNEVLFREDGRILSFSSFKELEIFIKESIESGQDLIELSKSDFDRSGRVSLLLAYNIEADEAEKYQLNKKEVVEVNSSDSMLLYLLNKNGEISIEGAIYRIDGEFVYTYKHGNENEIESFLLDYKVGKIKVSDQKTIIYNKFLKVYKHGNNKKEYSSRGIVRHESFSNDRSVKMRLEQFDQHWYFYSSIGAKTKTEQYRKVWFWNTWVTVKTNNRLKFGVAYQAKIVGTNIRMNRSPLFDNISNHTNEVMKIYEFCVGTPALFHYTAVEGYTEHWAEWYGNTAFKVVNY
ncbi:hypothetical protein [Tenacibaculum ovolyticum]|uniref:hypothetical protein n=1 Tax=Tenacibaculum ovolyticum TaxID=104270 RepID=UPI0007ECCE7C|nr:hypothetical protein [Tenacibaculum ovolyticum]